MVFAHTQSRGGWRTFLLPKSERTIHRRWMVRSLSFAAGSFVKLCDVLKRIMNFSVST